LAEIRNEYLKVVNEFIDLCVQTFNDQIESIVLWGSAARGDFVPRISDIDILLFFKDEAWREEEIFEEWSWQGIKTSRLIKEGIDSVRSKLVQKHPWLKNLYNIIHVTPLTQSMLKDPLLNPFRDDPLDLGAMISDHKILYGYDPLKSMNLPAVSKKFALRTMAYAARNTELKIKRIKERPQDKITALSWMMKNGILASQCFLHYHGIHIFGGRKVLEEFSANFPELKEETNILNDLWETRRKLLSGSAENLLEKSNQSPRLIRRLLERILINLCFRVFWS
jgi:hypothetical protein